jgi:hypothetical protein
MAVTDSNNKITTGTSATICRGSFESSFLGCTAELALRTSGDTWYTITAESFEKNPGNQVESQPCGDRIGQNRPCVCTLCL